VRSLALWKEFFAAAGQRLFHETGVLWLAGKDDSRVRQAAEVLGRCGVGFEELSRAQLDKRYPQIGLDGRAKGLLEPYSGVQMARRSVAAVTEDAQRIGVEYLVAQIAEPRG
jgi:N-methyl-L-tryptophan oxidase